MSVPGTKFCVQSCLSPGRAEESQDGSHSPIQPTADHWPHTHRAGKSKVALFCVSQVTAVPCDGGKGRVPLRIFITEPEKVDQSWVNHRQVRWAWPQPWKPSQWSTRRWSWRALVLSREGWHKLSSERLVISQPWRRPLLSDWRYYNLGRNLGTFSNHS